MRVADEWNQGTALLMNQWVSAPVERMDITSEIKATGEEARCSRCVASRMILNIHEVRWFVDSVRNEGPQLQ